ncbi:MAG: hypothetical protein ABIQ99_05300 [Thermoflexales bacterium]
MTDWRDEIRYMGGSLKAEQALTTRMEQDVRTVVRAAERTHGKPMRAQHAAPLAGVRRAYLRIPGRLPPDLQVGFLRPGAEYAAHIRYSNAASTVGNGPRLDLRGCAVRIVIGPNTVHDLLMTNAERHHARDAWEATATMWAFGGHANLIGLLRLATRLGPSRALAIARVLREQMAIPVDSLASETWWGRAPYAFGKVALRFHLAPLAPKPRLLSAREDLASEFKARLKHEDVRYDLRIQRYVDSARTSLNDASRAWLAPHETIAELVLPSQELRPEDEAFVDGLAFSPFNVAGSEFEPLGSMNRARSRLYVASQSMRR